MVNSNANAIGIIFPNSYDNLVPELAGDRLMASIPFAGRYRIIDFLLSSLANCGISNISIVVRENYHSLMDHLGSGREWDLLRKNGGLSMEPTIAFSPITTFSATMQCSTTAPALMTVPPMTTASSTFAPFSTLTPE